MSPNICLSVWIVALFMGYRWREKLPVLPRWVWKLLFAVTGILMVLAVLSIWFGQRFSVVASATEPEEHRVDFRYRDLGKLVPPSRQMLAELERTEKREKAEAEKAAKALQKAAEKAAKEQAPQTFAFQSAMPVTVAPGSTAVVVTGTSGSVVTMNGSSSFISHLADGRTVTPSLKSDRKGPFCRMTCAFHHGVKEYTETKDSWIVKEGTADVEVEAKFCNDGKIDPDRAWVPGWVAMSPLMEMLNDWPGPNNPAKGLDSYKLYWKDTR